ncbi:hypothetical protein BJ138DRAFT_1119503 [Hygrophoropsis aurantiaca]|uniref:Uncharacterized protein n=1 Tax=Hygrophoropsis aurantiaca TaxID=72124 RepID=A0ACB7ZVH2_9AGAM|nr:hypothetical protein BJ138DRAFT_1119503 [Hygrophoropsis aurantiaca]
MAQAGNFFYNCFTGSFSLYASDAWERVDIPRINTQVRHPGGLKSTIGITSRALPCWKPVDGQVYGSSVQCRFGTVDELLGHFRTTFDASKVKVRVKVRSSAAEVSGSSVKRAREETSDHGRSEGSGFSNKRQKQKGKQREERQVFGAKDLSQFVRSTAGFPDSCESVDWDAGFRTHAPFAGTHMTPNKELQVVKDIAGRPSLECSARSGSVSERCGSGTDAFQVRDLVVELELDPALRNPAEHSIDDVHEAWSTLVDTIANHMAGYRSVVIRGWKKELPLCFDDVSIGLQMGDLGQRCEWIDGILMALARDDSADIAIHRRSSLKQFLDLTGDPTICGNFLDAKNVNPSPPQIITPLLDSTTAWNQTLYMRLVAEKKKKKGVSSTQSLVEESPPIAVRTSNWTSAGWRLVTHPGFVTFPHHDCCGMGTYVVGDVGCKIWAVMRPKRSTTLQGRKRRPSRVPAGGNRPKKAILCSSHQACYTACTHRSSVFSGGYFYNYNTMHLTRAVLSMVKHQHLTNDSRPGYFRTLCRMVIALRYRSGPRKFNKRSLLSLLLIILHRNKYGWKLPSGAGQTVLAEEESGEMTVANNFAAQILKWLNMTVNQAKQYVDGFSAYYEPGDEEVVLPAVVEGKDPVLDEVDLSCT